MATVKKLIYGTDEIRLGDDTDIEALRASIENALHRQESSWVEIERKGHTSWVLITSGIPVRVETHEAQAPRSHSRVL